MRLDAPGDTPALLLPRTREFTVPSTHNVQLRLGEAGNECCEPLHDGLAVGAGAGAADEAAVLRQWAAGHAVTCLATVQKFHAYMKLLQSPLQPLRLCKLGQVTGTLV